MYVPPDFALSEERLLSAVMREHGFALLVSATPDGPYATHLPVLLEGEADGHRTLYGHMARANPHWQVLERDPRALVVFSGAHAYVSPRHYAAHPAVPTWNYVAVHAYGRARLITDPEALDGLLARMVAVFEGADERAWRFDSLPPDFKERQIKGIVGFRMPIDGVEGKVKLSQNRPKGDAERVAAALAASTDASARDTAAAMRRFGVVGGKRSP